MAKAKEDQNVKDGGQPTVNGHPDNLVPRVTPDSTTAATEERLKEVKGQKPTAYQEQEIDHIVEATSLPRALIQEQVLAKHPSPVDEELVNAEDDDASRATVEPGLDLLPEPKRVVKGTPGTPGDLTR